MKKIIAAAKQSGRGRNTSTISPISISLKVSHNQGQPRIAKHHQKHPYRQSQHAALFVPWPLAIIAATVVWGLIVMPAYADKPNPIDQYANTNAIDMATIAKQSPATLSNSTQTQVSDNANPPRSVASFDIDTLKARGLDPQIAHYFSQAPRFQQGKQVVTLVVNGQKRGLIEAQFDHQGELCLSPDFFSRANLIAPAGIKMGDGDNSAQTSCLNKHPDLEKIIIDLHPQRSEVALIVPTDRLRKLAAKPVNYATGGTGALVNYQLLSMNSHYGDYSNHYFSAATDLGLNIGNWIMRSYENYQINSGRNTFTHLYAYAQKTFADYGATFQAGQINIANSLFSGAQITGMQIFPETALSETSTGSTQINGIAQTQARIEVHQSGALVYSTLVPAGPFSLSNIPLLSGSNDLDVTVIESNGAQQKFVVPAASIQRAGFNRPGYSLALGKMRNVGGTSNDKPWVTTATGVWPVTYSSTATAGLMAANAYQGLGGGIDWSLQKKTNVSWRSLLANAQREKVRGIPSTLSIGTTFKESLSASLSATQQTPGYRDPLDNSFEVKNASTNRRYQGQYTATLNWTNTTLGGFNLSYSYATSRSATEVAPASKRLTSSWSKTFPRASVTLNFEKNLSSTRAGEINSDAIYLNIHIPLGSRSVKTYMYHRDQRTRFGTELNERVNEYANYSIKAEYDKQREETDISGSLALLPRYTQLNLSYGRHHAGNYFYTGQLLGGIALHNRGVTFSPYSVQDTFGIVSVSDIAGVKINTPNGPVWTDRWGKAVLSQLPSYQIGRIEIATKTLPRNTDLVNGFKMVEAGRGSVNHVDFDVIKVRRALLLVTDHQNKPLAKGASVLRADNSFVTIVGENGQIFLSNNQLGEKLRVALSENTLCELKFTLPEKADTQTYYEKVNAICQPPEKSNKKIK